MIPITIRAAVETDKAFIFDSTLKGIRLPVYAAMVPSVFTRRFKPILEKLLSNSAILVACLPDDPNVIAAYIIYSSFMNIPVIHYVHTRKMFQKQGIAKELCLAVNPHFGTDITAISNIPNQGIGAHAWTLPFFKCLEKYNLTYDPFLITGV